MNSSDYHARRAAMLNRWELIRPMHADEACAGDKCKRVPCWIYEGQLYCLVCAERSRIALLRLGEG